MHQDTKSARQIAACKRTLTLYVRMTYARLQWILDLEVLLPRNLQAPGKELLLKPRVSLKQLVRQPGI